MFGRFGRRAGEPRPPLPVDLRIIAAVNVIAGTTLLILLALGVMVVIAIMLMSLWADRRGQSQAAAYIVVYLILLLEMALLILCGTQIYIRRLLRACITLGVFIVPGVYGLIALPSAGLSAPGSPVIAGILLYPLVILVYVAFRAWKMRNASSEHSGG